MAQLNMEWENSLYIARIWYNCSTTIYTFWCNLCVDFILWLHRKSARDWLGERAAHTLGIDIKNTPFFRINLPINQRNWFNYSLLRIEIYSMTLASNVHSPSEKRRRWFFSHFVSQHLLTDISKMPCNFNGRQRLLGFF